MPVSAETLSRLIEAGVSGAALVAIVESIDADMAAAQPVADEAAERRRAKDRERKRAQRASVCGHSADISADSADTKENAPQTPQKENPTPKKNPPKGGQKERVAPKAEQKRAHRLPADWTPPESIIEIATGLGMSRVQAIDQAERMRDWSVSAPGGAKKDWHAAFRNWVKRAMDRGDFRNDAGSQPTRAEQSRSAFAAALRAKGYSPEGDGGEPVPRGSSPQLRLVASARNGQPGCGAPGLGD